MGQNTQIDALLGIPSILSINYSKSIGSVLIIHRWRLDIDPDGRW